MKNSDSACSADIESFFESIRGKLDYELDAKALAKREKYRKEYVQYLHTYYKTHPMRGIETFKVEAISDTSYYVSYVNTYEDKLPKSLFDSIGVVLERNKWYEAVMDRYFDSNEPIRVESAKETDLPGYDDDLKKVIDGILTENINAL